MVKVKVHTLIAPLRSESSPQKRSDMACVLQGVHPHVHPQSEWAILAFFLHTYGWYDSYPPRSDWRLSRPWCEVPPPRFEPAASLLQIQHSTTQPLAQLCMRCVSVIGNCLYGDYRGPYSNGLSCSAIGSRALWHCYNDNYYDDCCDTCVRLRNLSAPGKLR